MNYVMKQGQDWLLIRNVLILSLVASQKDKDVQTVHWKGVIRMKVKVKIAVN